MPEYSLFGSNVCLGCSVLDIAPYWDDGTIANETRVEFVGETAGDYEVDPDVTSTTYIRWRGAEADYKIAKVLVSKALRDGMWTSSANIGVTAYFSSVYPLPAQIDVTLRGVTVSSVSTLTPVTPYGLVGTWTITVYPDMTFDVSSP